MPLETVKRLLSRKARIRMPSAEGAAGYPRDLLELSEAALRDLLATNGNGHRGDGNGHRSHPRGAEQVDDDA